MPRRLLPGVLAIGFFLASPARSYVVPPAPSIDELARQCDLIIKAQALDSVLVQDAAFTDLSRAGYGVFATRLKVISVLKGDPTLAEITFHHYDKLTGQIGEAPYSPQTYHFTPNRPYILFAKKTDQPSVFRTFTFNHTSQREQGLVRAADSEPVPRNTPVKTTIWRELTTLAKSADSADVIYAIDHLDTLSRAPWYDWQTKADYARNDALDVICRFLASKDEAVARAALQAVGGASPYWDDAMPQGWLATVGKGQTLRRGFATYPANYANPSALRCRAQLMALARSSTSVDIRARAIRALGRSRENEHDRALVEPLGRWTTDPAAPVRASAAVLWSDYPSKEATAALESLARDKDPAVRAAAAYAIGYSQLTELLPILDRLLADSDESVRRAAALALLSFDLQAAGRILKAHLADRAYSVAFTNALAESEPAAYRDALVAILKANPAPGATLPGQIPMYTAWDILMNYVTTLEPAELRAGKFDTYLDALETPPNIGSSPYQTLYRFYHERGLLNRMQTFRTKARAQVTGYDLDFYLRQIDGRRER
jgi:HEAT repeat protein